MNFRYAIMFLLFAFGCSRPTSKSPIEAVHQDGKTIALEFNESISSLPTDSIAVFLEGAADPVLGSFSREGGSLTFTPIVHLTAGRSYQVRRGGVVLASITLDADTSAAIPRLLGIYPSGDSLAENTLKAYLKFSEPMMEGIALKHIIVIRNDIDTLNGTFLDLQPELWNEDGTILTLWFDPGRVKRDLIPNKTMGNPLQAGSRYSIIVADGWRSKAGRPTAEVFKKQFIATARDEKSPDPRQWVVTAPDRETRHVLTISFHEGLDYLLVLNAIHVIGPNSQPVPGNMAAGAAELSLQFMPQNPWKSGNYTIEIESRLEDPAGNNLSRLFDQDVTKTVEATPERPTLLTFAVR